jgi:hypothetical protein
VGGAGMSETIQHPTRSNPGGGRGTACRVAQKMREPTVAHESTKSQRSAGQAAALAAQYKATSPAYQRVSRPSIHEEQSTMSAPVSAACARVQPPPHNQLVNLRAGIMGSSTATTAASHFGRTLLL